MVRFSELADKQIDPREIKYRLSNKSRKIITKCLDTDDDDDNVMRHKLKEIMDKEEGDKQLVTYDGLSEIFKCLQKLDSTTTYTFFYQLLDEANVILPEQSKNPELKARLAKLKCQAAAQEYSKMGEGLRIVATNTRKKTTNLSDMSQVNNLTTALINGVMIVICSFLFVYKAVEYGLPQKNPAAQVLIALLATIVVAIAELYFFIRVM